VAGARHKSGIAGVMYYYPLPRTGYRVSPSGARSLHSRLPPSPVRAAATPLEQRRTSGGNGRVDGSTRPAQHVSPGQVPRARPNKLGPSGTLGSLSRSGRLYRVSTDGREWRRRAETPGSQSHLLGTCRSSFLRWSSAAPAVSLLRSRLTRHHEHFDSGAFRRNDSAKFETAHPGHSHVRQRQIN
jgi:hypothetical protein